MLELKKGEKVILKGFTGIKLGVFEVASTTKKTITVLKKNGDEMVFDRKTGKQVNVEEGKERYANSIMEDDGSFVAPSTVSAKRKSTKKAAAKAKAKPEPEDDEEDEEEDEAPKAKKPEKSASKKSSKSSKKPAKKAEPEDEDEEDEDEYEEVDD